MQFYEQSSHAACFCSDEYSSVGTVKLRLVLHMHEEFHPIHTLQPKLTVSSSLHSSLCHTFPPPPSSRVTALNLYSHLHPPFRYHTSVVSHVTGITLPSTIAHSWPGDISLSCSMIRCWTKGWSPSQAGDKWSITMDLWWNTKNCVSA